MKRIILTITACIVTVLALALSGCGQEAVSLGYENNNGNGQVSIDQDCENNSVSETESQPPLSGNNNTLAVSPQPSAFVVPAFLSFLSLEDFLEAQILVREGRSILHLMGTPEGNRVASWHGQGGFNQALETLGFAEMDILHLPTEIPADYQVAQIVVDANGVIVRFMREEHTGSPDDVRSAWRARQHFTFSFLERGWYIPEYIGSGLYNMNLPGNIQIAERLRFGDSTNTLFWYPNERVTGLQFPVTMNFEMLNRTENEGLNYLTLSQQDRLALWEQRDFQRGEQWGERWSMSQTQIAQNNQALNEALSNLGITNIEDLLRFTTTISVNLTDVDEVEALLHQISTTPPFTLSFDLGCDGIPSNPPYITSIEIPRVANITRFLNDNHPAFPMEDPTREDYVFAGWFFDQGITRPLTDLSRMPSNDVTLYARWESIHPTLTLNLNPSPNIPLTPAHIPPISIPAGSPILNFLHNSQAIPPAGPVKANHGLLGWYLDAELTLPIDEASLMPNEDISLYAKWLDLGTAEMFYSAAIHQTVGVLEPIDIIINLTQLEGLHSIINFNITDNHGFFQTIEAIEGSNFAVVSICAFDFFWPDHGDGILTEDEDGTDTDEAADGERTGPPPANTWDVTIEIEVEVAGDTGISVINGVLEIRISLLYR